MHCMPVDLFLSGFGTMLFVLGGLALIPFVVFVFMGLWHVQPSNWLTYNVTSDGFSDLVQVCFP